MSRGYLVYQKVLGFEIAMQDIAAVAIIETLEQLEYDTLVRAAYLDFGDCYLSFAHLHVLS